MSIQYQVNIEDLAQFPTADNLRLMTVVTPVIVRPLSGMEGATLAANIIQAQLNNLKEYQYKCKAEHASCIQTALQSIYTVTNLITVDGISMLSITW